jgi:hypothetical protein
MPTTGTIVIIIGGIATGIMIAITITATIATTEAPGDKGGASPPLSPATGVLTREAFRRARLASIVAQPLVGDCIS